MTRDELYAVALREVKLSTNFLGEGLIFLWGNTFFGSTTLLSRDKHYPVPGVHTLEYKDGRAYRYHGSRGHYYLLDEKTFLSFLPIPAWCRTCQGIKEVEEVSSVSDLEIQLIEIDSPDSPIRALRQSESFIPSWKATLGLKIYWRKRRTLPASCLTCGQRDLFFFPPGEWIPHPQTGEPVRLACTGMCSTSFAKDFFDIDGHRLNLSEEKRQEYWEIAKKHP